MTPDQYCRSKAANSGSSFYYSFLLLPREKRRAIMALYAFCREVDDAVDECADPGVAAAKLAWWRKEVADLFDGRPQHPVGRALLPLLDRFPLAQEHFQEIIDGMEMDLSQNRYEDFKSLDLYCYRVAGVVGRLAAEIFGYHHLRTLQYAHHLGTALQLTNIIRDVGWDARRGRIYLPLEDLRRFGVTPAQILSRQDSKAFRQLMAFQVERAREYYRRALAELPPEDRKSQRPGLVMAAIYRTLLQEIAADGCRVLTHSTRLPPLRKIWIAGATWLRN